MGTRVPGNERSPKRKVLGMKVLHRDFSFLGMKGLGYEKSVIPSFEANSNNELAFARTDSY